MRLHPGPLFVAYFDFDGGAPRETAVPWLDP